MVTCEEKDDKERRRRRRKNSSAIKFARRSIGERNACLLKTLCYMKKNQRKSFLRTADNNLIKCIQECVYNTLEGNVPLENHEKSRLAKHKSILRRIAVKRGNWKSKRNLLVQHGGFLPYLIAPLLSAILARIIGE
jgi:hypothetical protein